MSINETIVSKKMNKLFLTLAAILLMTYQQWSLVVVLAQCPGDDDWTGQVTLHEANEYTLQYKVQDERLVIRLRAKTTGFLGFGLSEAGHMLGSDIVTVAVVNGEARLEDRLAGWAPFSVDGPLQIATPSIDDDQSWESECASESGGYTDVILSRPLITEDCSDRDVVEGNMFVIFAWSDSDLVTYHGANRGSTVVNFFAAPAPATFTPPDDADESFEFVLNNYQLPSDVTQYVLQITDFGTENKHIVAVEPIIREEDQEFVHHILVHDCGSGSTSPGNIFGASLDTPYWPERPFRNVSPLGLGSCLNMIAGWAKGGGPIVFPPEAGVRTGNGGARWLVLEVHIDNRARKSGNIIRSGVRLHLSSTLREHEIGTIALGDSRVNFPTLPAGQERVHREGTCTSACTNAFSGPINLIISFPHMHSYGKEIWTSLNGEVISSKQYWNFGFQNQIPLNVTVNKGDVLSTHCVYDTTRTTSSVKFGVESSQEMCVDFISYWPKSNFNRLFCGYSKGQTICGSSVSGINPIPDGDTGIPAAVSIGCGANVEAPAPSTPTNSPPSSDASIVHLGLMSTLLSMMVALVLV